MTNNISHKNYTEYSFEDFLQDDFFVSSMKNPTTESLAYWSDYQKQNINIDVFVAAKDCIELINTYHHTLSPASVEKIRRSIHKKKGRKKLIRRLSYLSIAAAACIALLMVIPYGKSGKKEIANPEFDIVAFADVARSKNKAKEIQLVLSENQTILLEQEETTITYDSTGIIVDKNAIVQDEVTAFNQLIVPLGKRSVLILSDGTKVWVNSDSRLIYPVSFAENQREIYVDGEIFIDVVTDIERPFIVKTKDMDVKVLGTRFNVMAYDTDDEKSVVLVSGSVQIDSRNEGNTTRLSPEQMYIIENGKSQIQTVDTEKYTSWINGIYYCEDESLDRILQRLSRYYGVEIQCDPSISGVLFSGKLDLKDNLSDIFHNISFTLPITYVKNEGKFVISRLK